LQFGAFLQPGKACLEGFIRLLHRRHNRVLQR
jgi:hypothetical protein